MSVKALGFAPLYELYVNGTKLEDDVLRHIAGVLIEQSVDGADMAKLSVDAIVDGVATAEVIDSYIFAEGNSLEIWAGYENEPPTHMGRFDLQVPGQSGDRNGQKVEVVGLSAAHKLLTRKFPWRFEATVTDKEIVETIARDAGLESRVAEMLPRAGARVKEAGVSDWEFLNRIAAEGKNLDGLEFRWYVRWEPEARQGRGADVLVFEPFRVDTQAEQYEFFYRPQDDLSSTLRSYGIMPSLLDTPTKVSVVYLNRQAGEEREVVAEVADSSSDPEVLWSGLTGGLKGIEAEIKDGACVRLRTGDPFEERNPVPLEFEDDTEAVLWVRRWFRRRQEAFCVTDFVVVGLPKIRPWDVHRFSGIANRWNGHYMVTYAKHRLQRNGVYEVDLTANRLPPLESFPAGASL